MSFDLQIKNISSYTKSLTKIDFLTSLENWDLGQYLVLSPDEQKDLYLAIASHPDENELSIIVKSDAAIISYLNSHSSIKSSIPQGNGFPKQLLDFSHLLFLAHGTGISAIRPLLIETYKRSPESATFIYGCKSSDEIPNDTSMKNVDLISAESDTNGEHVQDCIKSFPLEKPNQTGVFMVGSNEFQETCQSLLLKSGIVDTNIGKNF